MCEIFEEISKLLRIPLIFFEIAVKIKENIFIFRIRQNTRGFAPAKPRWDKT